MTISDTRLAIAAGMTSGEVLPEASYCEAVEDAPWMLRLQFDDFQQTSGTLSGHARNSGLVFSGSVKDYNAAIPCFTGNSVVATRTGLTRVADLRQGDLVLTRDNGLQPLRWIGTRRFGWRALGLNPMLRAVRICAGALGAGMPARDMLVSPNHRFLIVSDGDERLLPAYSLLGRAGVSRVNASDVCYYQLMCEAHELVMVDECWSESYRATVAGLSALDSSARDQLTQILPDLSSGKDGFAPVRADVPIAL